MAAAPVYFDLGGLMLIVVGGIFVLFVLVGRLKGFVAFVVLSAGFLGWATFKDQAQKRAATLADRFVSDQCFSAAGVVQETSLASVPMQVLIRADRSLSPGSQNALRTYIPDKVEVPGIERVDRFIEPRQAGAVYVDIVVIRDPIEGAESWRLNGLRTAVSDANGRVIATHTDYQRSFGWCLGEEPRLSIEKFLQTTLGRSTGLAALGDKAADRLPVHSPRGSAKPAAHGRFHEASAPQEGSRAEQAARKLAGLPREADCSFDDKRPFDEVAVCLKGTPHENVLDLRQLAATHRTSTSWFSLSSRTSGARDFDSLDIVEHALDGAVLNRWHFRFPRIDVPDHGGVLAVRNVSVKDRRLTADVVFDRHVLAAGQPAAQQGLKEWFATKVEVAVDLVGPDKP